MTTQANTARKVSPFASRQAANQAPVADAAEKRERIKAQVFLNFGYLVKVQTQDTEIEELISLPFGLELDTMNHMKMSGNSEDYANKVAARNKFLDDILGYAEELAPGEAVYLLIDEETGFAVELRRRGTPAAASDENPYVRRVEFARPQ